MTCDAERGQPVLGSAISLIEVVYLCEKVACRSIRVNGLEEAVQQHDAVLRVTDVTLSVVQALARLPREHVPDLAALA